MYVNGFRFTVAVFLDAGLKLMISASYDLFKLRGHDIDVRTEYLH